MHPILFYVKHLHLLLDNNLLFFLLFAESYLNLNNLYKHISNLHEKFGLNVIVAINKYNTDTEQELRFVENQLAKKGIKSSLVESWAKGGNGAIDIATKLVELVDAYEK